MTELATNNNDAKLQYLRCICKSLEGNDSPPQNEDLESLPRLYERALANRKYTSEKPALLTFYIGALQYYADKPEIQKAIVQDMLNNPVIATHEGDKSTSGAQKLITKLYKSLDKKPKTVGILMDLSENIESKVTASKYVNACSLISAKRRRNFKGQITNKDNISCSTFRSTIA